MKNIYNNLWEKWNKTSYIHKLVIKFIIGLVIISFLKDREILTLYLVATFSWFLAIIFYSSHLEDKKKEEERRISKEKNNKG